MPGTRRSIPVRRLERLEERLSRARSELLDLEGEIAALRRELGGQEAEKPSGPDVEGRRLLTVK